MKIKICGLFRERDIDYVNEARPDYAGFVFAHSRREVSAAQAGLLRRRLADAIVPVGVFVNAPAGTIAALYRAGTIAIAQLHGGESEDYIMRLKDISASGGTEPVPVIKVVKVINSETLNNEIALTTMADYLLLDSGSGSGKTFNWDMLTQCRLQKPWFLAGGITVDNIKQAMALNPFAVDVSGGAETDGSKDKNKIMRLKGALNG